MPLLIIISLLAGIAIPFITVRVSTFIELIIVSNTPRIGLPLRLLLQILKVLFFYFCWGLYWSLCFTMSDAYLGDGYWLGYVLVDAWLLTVYAIILFRLAKDVPGVYYFSSYADRHRYKTGLSQRAWFFVFTQLAVSLLFMLRPDSRNLFAWVWQGWLV